MEKQERFKQLTTKLYETLCIKNSKYGDSHAVLRNRYKVFPVILIRLEDKLSRLNNLLLNVEEGTADESIEDTLLDLAGYCMLELSERMIDSETRANNSKTLLRDSSKEESNPESLHGDGEASQSAS